MLDPLPHTFGITIIADSRMMIKGSLPGTPYENIACNRNISKGGGDWEAMRDYVSQLNENTQDGAMLRAVLAVKSENYDVAVSYIDKVRDMYDSELTAMASESYERAYGAMICVQQLAELEEAIEFKIRPERQTRIALLWSRRLQGCRQNIEQWQRLLMLRSLVLTPQEMHPLRVKFSSLCRKQGKNVMCRDVLRELLGLDPSAPLHKAVVPNDKPQLVVSIMLTSQLTYTYFKPSKILSIVLALCKQLWMDDYRDEAVGKLEALVNYLDRQPLTHTPEAARLCAKACLKLGEWTEILFQNALSTADNVALSGSQRSLFGESNDDQTATEQIIRHYARSTEYDKDWHKLMPSQISPMPMHNASLLSPPVVPVNINYAVSAVKCFTRALQLAP
ncbi:hypothetical protein DICVIV_09521, partial [Dictyocaulus viviparus]